MNTALLQQQILALRAQVNQCADELIHVNVARFKKYERSEDVAPFLPDVYRALNTFKESVKKNYAQALPDLVKFIQFLDRSRFAISYFRAIEESVRTCIEISNRLFTLVKNDFQKAMDMAMATKERLERLAEDTYRNTERSDHLELCHRFQPTLHVSSYGRVKEEIEKHESSPLLNHALAKHRSIIVEDNDALDAVEALSLSLDRDISALLSLKLFAWNQIKNANAKKEGLLAKRNSMRGREKGEFGSSSFDDFFEAFEKFVSSLPGASSELIALSCAKVGEFKAMKRDREFTRIDSATNGFQYYLVIWVRSLRNYCLHGGLPRHEEETA